MTRGRRRIYQESSVVTLKCERALHETMRFLRIPDNIVYSRGAVEIAKDRASDLTSEKIQIIIQENRQHLKDIQEEIALLERLSMDADIRQDLKKKKSIETRFDERGRPYAVVKSE